MSAAVPDSAATDAASTPPAIEKARLRCAALALRDGLELDARLEWDQAIAAHATALDVWSSGPVSAYWPMRSEADPRPILEELALRGLPLCLPAVVDGLLQFRQWTPWEPIVPGGFGTLVPPEGVAVLAPAVLIVPLAAFDRRGFRIGYGKGHYDRALAALGEVTTVGIAYAAQEIAEVPAEPHDRALDWIVTEEGAIRCL